MALKFLIGLRNAMLDAFEVNIGTDPILRLYDGTPPTNIGDADGNNVLVEMTLPTDWMNAGASASKTLKGTWSGVAAAAGDATHFRIFTSAGVQQVVQGTVTATGGGGDMTLDSVTISIGQTVTISTFTLTAGNA